MHRLDLIRIGKQNGYGLSKSIAQSKKNIHIVRKIDNDGKIYEIIIIIYYQLILSNNNDRIQLNYTY